MKTHTSILLAGAGFLTGYLVAPTPPPQESTLAPKAKALNIAATQVQPPAKEISNPEAAHADREDQASFARWEERFSALVAECGGNREAATAQLLDELDERYGRWITEQLTSLENASYVERVDSIGSMEESVREGATAILDRLGIPGSRNASVLPVSMEAISAEVQYGLAASTHEKRVALLRLEREREVRLSTLLADVSVETKAQAMGELDRWYDAGLRGISGSDEVN